MSETRFRTTFTTSKSQALIDVPMVTDEWSSTAVQISQTLDRRFDVDVKSERFDASFKIVVILLVAV